MIKHKVKMYTTDGDVICKDGEAMNNAEIVFALNTLAYTLRTNESLRAQYEYIRNEITILYEAV